MPCHFFAETREVKVEAKWNVNVITDYIYLAKTHVKVEAKWNVNAIRAVRNATASAS